MSIQTFLNMGGYAAYVWPSYAVTGLAVIWMIVGARRVHRAGLALARKRVEMEKTSP
jgi:heme exporter protein CcmD